MRKKYLWPLCLLSVSLLALTASLIAQTTPPQGIRDKTPDTRAFVGARIQVSPKTVIENGTLIVRNGRIEAVGSGIEIPPDAVVVDLKGRYIYPAFIDPVTEYGLSGVGEVNPAHKGRGPKYDGNRQGANAWNDAIHSERDWVDDFKADKKKSKSFIEQGIAVVQSSKFDGILRGRSFVTLLGEGLTNDLLLSPYSLHFASFDKGSSHQSYPNSLMGSIALLRQTFLDVAWYKQAHSAFAKDATQTMPEVNTAIEALLSLGGWPILFDTDDELDLLRAGKLSAEIGVPFVYVGSNYEYARLNEIKALKKILILPVDYPETPSVKTVEDEIDVNLSELRNWDMAPSNPAKLEAKKIKFAFTTLRLDKKDDFLPNIRRAVKRGLSPRRALEALTTVPAAICGVSDQVGTLDDGKLANFIVCDTNLFEAEAKIEAVWVRGVEHEQSQVQTVDLRGTYDLQLLNERYSLVIKGKIDKLSARLISGEDTVSAKSVKLSDDRVRFTAILEPFGVDQTTRFSARKDGDNLRGSSQLPDAGLLNWLALLTAPYSEEDEEAEKDDTEDSADSTDADKPESEDEDVVDTLLAHLTYPNMAYGYDALPKQTDVLIKNISVWTAEEVGILEGTDVLVEKGKFTRIGKNLTAPTGVLVIDGTGKHLSPGIIDEHSHIAISRGVNEGSHAVTAEVRIGDVVNPDHIAIYRALAGGTTIAQLLHGSANPIGGQAQVIKLRWGASPEQMKFSAAPPSIKFALGENVKQSNWGSNFRSRYPQSRMGVQTIMRDAFQAAREYEANWKEYNTMGRRQQEKTIAPRHDLQLDALLEILNSERFVHCHSYVQSEILMLMRLAEEFGFRIGTFTHILEGYKVAGEMAEHGASGSSFSDWWAYKFEVYDAIPYNTCLMHERGVVTSVNSDSQDLIRRLNTEAAKSVQYCGMSHEEAIKLVTINPAIQLKVDHRVGSIKVGKDADFVIWNNNPLSLYSKPEQTWIDGTKQFDIETDAALRVENARERRALIQKALNTKGSKDKKGGKSKRPHKTDDDWHCEDVFDVWSKN